MLLGLEKKGIIVTKVQPAMHTAKQKYLIKIYPVFLVTLIVGVFVVLQGKVQAKTNCFTTKTTGEIEWLPICDYAGLQESGFEMGTLPNPLDPAKCYLWGAAASDPGQEVDCNRSELVNAPSLDSSVPPPASLDNAAAGAKNNTSNNSATETPPAIKTPDQRKAIADCDGSTNPQQCLSINPLVGWILTAINFLAVGVGVVVTIMIIIGGIQYASAGANPQAVHAAKQKIANAIIALLAFFFLYAFLQYLIPGGIF